MGIGNHVNLVNFVNHVNHTLSYQILPNLIFILAILGILILILRRLPEAASHQEIAEAAGDPAARLSGKGLPAMAVSKIQSTLRAWIKKIWNFALEAKDAKPHALAGYRIRKMFGSAPKQAGTAAAAQEPRAEEHFLAAIKDEPKKLSHYDNLGKFYLEQGKIEDARDVYEYLVKHDPANADFHARMAYCHYQLKDYEKTVQHYRQSLALDSSQPNRYYNLGLVLEMLGRNREAHEAFRHAIALEPGNTRYYVSMSNVCLKLGAHDQALNALQKAHQFDPQNEKVVEKMQKLQTPQ